MVVADVSTVLAGPYCTMVLADLGAEVVKVEPPDGDATRGYRPPEVAGESAYYLSVNRNKRGIVLDLRTGAGRDVLSRLIARADILVENFRAGAFAGLGFDDETLEEMNPRLVHLAITGYGPDGPDASRPGYDFVIQAESGLMSITGMADSDGGRPTKVGVAIADLACGMLGASAVLAALHARDTPDGPSSGRGQRIDLSVFEATLAWLANQAASHLAGGMEPVRMGNAHPNIVPYETFATADGEIAVAVGSEPQWGRFCEAVGLDGLRDDPRFATNGDRVAHRELLRLRLVRLFAARPTSSWLAALRAADVPCAPINSVAEAFAGPQAQARRMVESVDHPAIGDLRLTGIPFKLSRTPASVRSAPPLLGQHTDEVLRWLGYDDESIDRLRAERVV